MIILLALPPAAAGCSAGGASGPEAEDGMLQIVATIFPAFDLAREASGGQAHVSMLLRPGEEIHSYEPTPMDIRMIRDCD
ncbi:MAG: zinc ABC transporter substrate-binding protein, partial [Lachnospiraceae bacterium]|nr:zinc ABC transporter substrate-binding protein [Lachnospiraceae bacterium]